ncbi:hypothetical protein HMPREF0063_12406 [Aeromicrobium marinum DSM 15272]|uniref:Uncharacterized protein n=2 Tax=Aeromicrobium marinum TaxID=219314 RepID=E2SEE7_9ACTN|nr:hypothetical protein HMPREF0063_12406 [Aeromicrobium marinum DSM 15272]
MDGRVMLTRRRSEIAFVLAVVVAGGLVSFFVVSDDAGVWTTMTISVVCFVVASVGVSAIRKKPARGKEP